MSFIVKGIDLPKDKTIVIHYANRYGEMETVYVDENDIIQIPRGHGNLKDENEIIKRLEEKEEEPLYQHDTDDWWVGIIDAETEVYTSPTILESEEKYVDTIKGD